LSRNGVFSRPPLCRHDAQLDGFTQTVPASRSTCYESMAGNRPHACPGLEYARPDLAMASLRGQVGKDLYLATHKWKEWRKSPTRSGISWHGGVQGSFRF